MSPSRCFSALVASCLLSALFPLAAAAAPPDAQGSLAQEIVGGEYPVAHRWPDAAGIRYRGDVQCSGTLIHPSAVATAAHCVVDSSGVPLRPDTLAVVLDTPDYSRSGEQIPVQSVHAHPLYSDGRAAGVRKSFDVAVLLLAHPSQARPRLRATSEEARRLLQVGTEVTAVGFGTHDEAGTARDPLLREANLEVFSPRCDGSSSCIPDHAFLARAGSGNPCYGDSGGPIYLRTERGQVLAGLTQGWLREDIAEDSEYLDWDDCAIPNGVYVRVDAHRQWIDEQIGSLGAPTAPTGTMIESGCGCRSGGAGAASGGALPLALALALSMVTRRRRARRA